MIRDGLVAIVPPGTIKDDETTTQWQCDHNPMPEKLCFTHLYSKESNAYWIETLPHRQIASGQTGEGNMAEGFGRGIWVKKGPPLKVAWLIYAFVVMVVLILFFTFLVIGNPTTDYAVTAVMLCFVKMAWGMFKEYG